MAEPCYVAGTRLLFRGCRVHKGGIPVFSLAARAAKKAKATAFGCPVYGRNDAMGETDFGNADNEEGGGTNEQCN